MKTFLVSAFCLSLSAAVLAQDVEIYVSDAGNFNNPPWQILKFDQNGDNPQVFIDSNLAWPQDIVFLEDDNIVLVSNLNSSVINRHDAQTGEFIDVFSADVSQPTRMKIGPDQRLYVLQWSGSGRVRRFELDGALVDDFTDAGVVQSIGMDWDADGNLYVASFSGRSVRKFDPQGNDQGLFIDSDLEGPTNIWFADNGDLLVLDWRGGAVKRFDADGNLIGNFITGLSQPEGVDFLPDGRLLLGNGGAGSVRMYEAAGSFVEDLVSPGAGGLIQPNAVVVRTPGTADDFQINAGLNDAWFNLATAGQGFFIIVFPELQQVFLSWFTFDTERPMTDTAVLGGAGQRWLTAQGPFAGNTANLTLFETTGGIFDAASPPAVTDAAGIGTLVIEFSDCTAGLITYDLPGLGLAGEIPIQRITADNVALCESIQQGATRG